MRVPGPLWRRSALRLLRGGPWGVLVIGAFTLLGAAAAAEAPFTEAAANASLATVLATVPEGAAAAQAPVVRVVGGSTSPKVEDQQLTAARVAAIPGLGPVSLSGFSIGAEIDPNRFFASTVALGRRTADVRLAALPDPGARLVLAGGAGTSPAAAGGDGIWLPEPVARQLGADPGASLTLTVRRGATGRRATATTLAGVYDVAGRIPADRPGSTFWTSHEGEIPTVGRYALTPAWLAVARVPVAQRLADALDDQLLWAVEAAPLPGVPTLAGYSRTAAAVDSLRFLLRDPRSGVETAGVLRTTVASGFPDLVSRADAVSRATQARVDTLARAALALAGGVVVAAALLGLARRRSELQLSVALGLGPARVAGLAAVEHLPAAVTGALAGTALAALLVVVAGPPGTVTPASLRTGTAAAAVAVVSALVVVAGLWAGAHVLAARRRRERRRRPVPWEALLAVAAATATVGLLTTVDTGGSQGALAVLVPVLLLAGVGAVGGRLAVVVLGRVLGARAGRLPASAVRGRAAARRTARWLALRRLAAPSRERSAVVAVLTTGAGLLLFAQAAAASTRVTIDDRVAVAAGAAATADVPGSWALDPGAPSVRDDPDDPLNPAVSGRPVPGVRNPPLGTGRTLTWRTRVGDPTAFGTLDLLVVDPAPFGRAALWGSGAALARSRQLVDRLRDADERAAQARRNRSHPAVPVLAVGYPPGRVGDQLTIEPEPGSSVTVEVVGSATAFPGLAGLPMLVLPADALFGAIPTLDPRPRPHPNPPPSPFPTVQLWDGLGLPDLTRTLAAHAVNAQDVATAEAVRRQPELEAARQALPFQRAMGWGAAVVSLVAFALYVDRTVALAGAADLLLARVGLGSSGVRRSRVLEPVVMTVLSGALALLAVLALRPMAARLLDPQRSGVPAFVLLVDGRVVALGVAFLAVAAVVAAGVTLGRQRSLSPDRALRDA